MTGALPGAPAGVKTGAFQQKETLGQLAGGVAHDFSNMLSVINGYCDILLNSETTSKPQMELLQEIYIAGQRASKLCNQFLIYSHSRPSGVCAVDVLEGVAAITGLIQSLIGENILLRVETSEDTPPALASTGMIEHVLLNLALKSRGAMPSGGMLTIRIEGTAVDESFVSNHPGARTGKFVCISVVGAGRGPATHLFATEGTGDLDLAGVESMVRQHEGWFQAEGETMFRVFLPVSPEISGPASIPSSDAPITGGRETVLLVEDEASVRALAAVVLQKYGYRVLEAANAEEALEVWKRHAHRTDLLFTDLVMTGEMTGSQLAEQLQAEKPTLKVIYTSGYSAEMGTRVLELTGRTPFIQKPYQPRKLADVVRRTLDNTKEWGLE